MEAQKAAHAEGIGVLASFSRREFSKIQLSVKCGDIFLVAEFLCGRVAIMAMATMLQLEIRTTGA